jgi:hypothetical protein
MVVRLGHSRQRAVALAAGGSRWPKHQPAGRYTSNAGARHTDRARSLVDACAARLARGADKGGVCAVGVRGNGRIRRYRLLGPITAHCLLGPITAHCLLGPITSHCRLGPIALPAGANHSALPAAQPTNQTAPLPFQEGLAPLPPGPLAGAHMNSTPSCRSLDSPNARVSRSSVCRLLMTGMWQPGGVGDFAGSLRGMSPACTAANGLLQPLDPQWGSSPLALCPHPSGHHLPPTQVAEVSHGILIQVATCGEPHRAPGRGAGGMALAGGGACLDP